jgi:hypothetical protein
MELNARNQSIAEVRATNKKLIWGLLGALATILLLALKLATQSEIIINQTPGMPDHSIIEKTSMDRGAQHATLSTVTASISQVNPANYEYVKPLLQVYLAPTVYTRITQEIDTKVQLLVTQHELGSYYYVEKAYEYDPALNRHFIYGDVHTVNAGKDTATAYVFDYAIHVENYRLVVDDVVSYPGERAHNSEWLKANKK